MAAFTVSMSLSAPVAMKAQMRAPAPAAAAAPRRAAVRVAALRFSTVAAANAETLEKVRGIISEQLGMELDKVAAGSKFVDLGADSLDTVEIMMSLEETFGITLDEEGAEKITTVQEAADLIQSQLK